MRPATLILGAALIALPVFAYATTPSSAPASRHPAPALRPTAVPAPAAALARAFAEACDWTELALPTGYARPDVHAAGGHGVYAGVAWDLDMGRNEALLWQGGVARPLGDDTDVHDVNANGAVVGRGSGNTPVRYTAGYWEELPRPAGATGVATDINDAGDVLGALDHGRLIRWPAARPGTYELVVSPFPGNHTPIDLAEDGTLLARAVMAGGTTPAWLRAADGTWTLLQRAEGTHEVTPTAVAGDRVVGSDRGETALEWDRSGTITQAVTGFVPVDANAAGQVLGRLDPSSQPAVYRDGKLEAVLPTTFNGRRVDPRALDDDGTVLGTADGGDDDPDRVVVGRC